MKHRYWLLLTLALAVLRADEPELLPPLQVAIRSSTTAEPSSNRGVNPARLHELADLAEQELRGNILPFWLKHAPDPEHGGFHAFIGQDMKVRDDLPRGALLTSRILWTFSAAYRHYPDPAYLEMARRAYHDLINRFVDRQSGGLFWTASIDGQPVDSRKQIYGQVFGIYGLAEYYRATGERPALDQAIAIYRLLELHAHDPKNGGYCDVLNREWQPDPAPGANLLGNAPKSQNSHIHILEAFTNLLRVWPDPGLRERQRELIELMLTRIINPRTHHLVLFMQNDWTPIGDDISYGHDIELSWLLGEAAEVLGDPAVLARTKPVVLAMAQATIAEGVDTDGGIFNEGNPHGPTNTNKDWWSQAEATVGFLNAYQLSGDPAYFANARRSWDYIQEKFVDRKNGDWFESVQRNGTPLLELGDHFPHAKVSVWKCPYHNSRACLEVIDRVGELGAESKER